MTNYGARPRIPRAGLHCSTFNLTHAAETLKTPGFMRVSAVFCLDLAVYWGLVAARCWKAADGRASKPIAARPMHVIDAPI
ncbi:MAG: hypothetical protein AB7F78_07450 [Hyphomicrobiaceae bacterium]